MIAAAMSVVHSGMDHLVANAEARASSPRRIHTDLLIRYVLQGPHEEVTHNAAAKHRDPDHVITTVES